MTSRGSGSSAGEYEVPKGIGSPGGDRNRSGGSQNPPGGGGYTPPWEDDPNAAPEPDGPESWRDRVETDSLGWIDVVSSEVAKSLSAWGKNNGYSNEIMKNLYNQHAPQMFQEIQIWGFRGSDQMAYRTGTPEGMQEMVDWALNWWGGKVGIPLTRASSGGSGRGRRRGGGGRSGPTAQDIRNQFDMDELTNGVNEMWRAVVFEENPQARKLATEYVDAMVATRGEKKIDFATFVENKIKETSRFKTIYRNKPEHLSPTEYMAPYIGAARQFAAPEDADDIAIGGAQMGASQGAFQQRLMREDTVTGSSPFINGLEGRLSNLNEVFAGS